MYKTWRLIAEYDSETTSFTACAGAAQTSPWTPDFNGKLIGLRSIPNRSAATSLVNHIQFKLTSTSFVPNALHVGAQGTGLQTAPSQGDGHMDWACDQPIKSGVLVTVEGRNVTADTPVTVSCMLYGLFEVN